MDGFVVEAGAGTLLDDNADIIRPQAWSYELVMASFFLSRCSLAERIGFWSTQNINRGVGGKRVYIRICL